MNKENSLATRLSLTNAILLVFILATTAICGLFIASKYIDSNRKKIVSSTGALLVQLVERPLSQGDYSTLEGYLQKPKLPDSFAEIKVLDSEGIVVAERTFENPSCKSFTNHKFFVGTTKYSKLGLGQIHLSVGNCTIKEEKKAVFTYAFILLTIFLIIGWISTKYSISSSLTPLRNVVSEASKSGELKSEVFSAAPLEIRPLLKRLQQEAEVSAKKKVIDEIFHDIISPASALSNYLPSLDKWLPSSELQLIQSKTRRIVDLLNHIRRSTPIRESQGKIIPLNISTIVEEAVSEQQLANPDLSFQIFFNKKVSKFGVHGAAEKEQLFRVTTNIISNAIEAVKVSKNERKQNIEVIVNSSDSFAYITISDTGHGIPEEIQEKIFLTGFSTKESDKVRGLGLSTSRKIAKSWGGDVLISKTGSDGTTMEIKIPKSPIPPYFTTKIDISSISTVVIVDDELDLFESAKRKLNNYNITTKYFSSKEDFEKSVEALNKESTLFLIDYHFKGKPYKGTDIISTSLSGNRSILVTSMADNKEVIDFCSSNSVLLASKPDFEFIPLILKKSNTKLEKKPPKLVYLDDEDLNIKSIIVRTAKNKTETISFTDPDELLKSIDLYPSTTYFLLDQNLGDGKMKGVEVARQLKGKGFDQIYITSGEPPSSFEGYDFLKGFIFRAEPNQLQDFLDSIA